MLTLFLWGLKYVVEWGWYIHFCNFFFQTEVLAIGLRWYWGIIFPGTVLLVQYFWPETDWSCLLPSVNQRKRSISDIFTMHQSPTNLHITYIILVPQANFYLQFSSHHRGKKKKMDYLKVWIIFIWEIWIHWVLLWNRISFFPLVFYTSFIWKDSRLWRQEIKVTFLYRSPFLTDSLVIYRMKSDTLY